MKNPLLITVATIALFFLSCEKDDANENPGLTNFPQYKEKNYKIIVVDESNQPIANAVISDGTHSITTTTTGTATFNTPTETYGKYRFGISKDGYFVGSINLQTFSDPDETYKVMLLQSATNSSVPDVGGIVTGTDWTFTSTGGFNFENGTAANGNIDISIRYIRPDDFESFRDAFPGQDFIGLNGGNEGWMYVYGWIAINYSQNGVRVFPAAGSVTITVQVPGEYANAAQTGGKVFYYDEDASIWEESANPTVLGLNVTMPLPSQTSFCALGKIVPTATIQYKKTSCMPGDFYGYGVQIEYDEANMQNYINSFPGYCVDVRRLIPMNMWYGADLYPSGFALGNTMIFASHVTGSTDGSYTSGVFDMPGFENESFTFPAGYTGGFRIHSIRKSLKNGEENLPVSDRVIKEYASFPPGVTNLGILNTVCTGTTDNPHDNGPITSNGEFTYNGQTITGNCGAIFATNSSCGGIDVLITGLEVFVIYNMPTASSGTFNVGSNASNCNPTAATVLGGTSQSTSGTIIKTGEKSFTFTVMMENFSNGTTNQVATGFGSYD